ncbi:WD domain, G-beta repeat [Carpediemonas membranifera]|uniref:WD domain, G-beta repeat n=1 Tax=Carpediemonas membranifera TaxID=201153 RepID=A0A8J6E0B2_9EUKA|nr:WD domain, G-beta repeat [Carpediemonas membranifera]|eukprot:KAG9391958.1 WD domain, G-beta repeat [Carpediemonas membranifera]
MVSYQGRILTQSQLQSSRFSDTGLQIRKRCETPITIQDLEKADHENNRIKLALEAWDLRSTMNDEAVVRISTLTGHKSRVTDIATSPDGTIGTASDDGTIKQWRSNGRWMPRTHGGHVLCVAVSPDGSTIASGGSNRLIKLWDTTAGRYNKTLRGHTRVVRCLVFSSDGRTLVSGSDDKTAKIWDVEAGQCRLTLT